MADKYDDIYSGEELTTMAQRVRVYDRQVRRVAVTFNNNREDSPLVNALELKRLLGLRDTPAWTSREAGPRPAGSTSTTTAPDAILLGLWPGGPHHAVRTCGAAAHRLATREDHEDRQLERTCGHSQEYLPWPELGGSWQLVPVWDPEDRATNPLERYGPADL